MNTIIRLSIPPALLLMCAGVGAQTAYPEKPVRIVVPGPAGGGFDVIARVVAQKFSEA